MKKSNKIFKLILCMMLILGVCGCKRKDQETEKKQEIIKDNEDKEFVEPYIDENPIELSLYVNQNGTRTLTTTFSSPLTIYQDILSLEVFYTKETTLTGDQKKLWQQYYSNYTNIDNYKIGYQISFQVGTQTIQQTILTPNDSLSIFEYIQIYLYDDLHQEDAWYDHITQEEVTDNTLLTSIKLTASTKIDEITSPIMVTAFTYNTNDLDEEGNYQGKSKTEITITRQS